MVASQGEQAQAAYSELGQGSQPLLLMLFQRLKRRQRAGRALWQKREGLGVPLLEAVGVGRLEVGTRSGAPNAIC